MCFCVFGCTERLERLERARGREGGRGRAERQVETGWRYDTVRVSLAESRATLPPGVGLIMTVGGVPTPWAVIGGVCILAAVLTAILRGLQRYGFFLSAPSNEYEAFHQSVLRKLRWNFYTLFHCNKYKHDGVARFAWAIPNAKAIDAIISETQRSFGEEEHRNSSCCIVDFGAGSGYWPLVLSERVRDRKLDIEVIAVEKSLNLYARRDDGSIGLPDGSLPLRSDLWYDVRPGDLSTLVELQKRRPVHTLLLVWPPCWEDMAFDAVRVFKGNCVVYVGEPKGGCTVRGFITMRNALFGSQAH